MATLFTVATVTGTKAQTVLLDPNGDGGFESGATFAANGWTVVNNTSATANNWAIGGGAVPGFRGARAAYISNNSTVPTPSHTYNNTLQSTVHLYRDITFPAGETVVNFSFSLIQTGEFDWDRLLIFVSNGAPTGTPVAGTPLSNANTISGYTLLMTTPQQAAWTDISTTIPASLLGNATAASTRRLLLVWQNDDNTGGDPPAGIDNMLITSATCQSPITGLSTSAVRNTSATLTWGAVTGATGYSVRYKLVSDPYTVATWATPTSATTNSLAITGLTPNARYEFQVAATGVTCTQFSTSATFMTLCNAITTIPYLESFSATLPACWSVTEGTSGATTHWESVTADAAHGAGAPRAGTNFMRLNVFGAATGNNPYYLTSAPVTLPATGTMNLRYYYYLGANGYRGRTGATGTDPYPLVVQVSTNGVTWTDLFSHDTTNSVFATSNAAAYWLQNNISLASYSGQTIQIRFKSLSNNSAGTWTNQGIDEVSIDVPCTPPTITGTTPASRCGMGPITLGATTSAGSAVVARWYTTATGGIPIFTGNSLSIPMLTATTTYYVAANDTNTDCMSATRTAVVATYTAAPALTLTSPQSPGVCTGGTATITASSTNTGYGYTWSTGQTTATITVTPTASTTYIVNALDPVSNCAIRDSIRLLVSAPPTAPTLSPATATICAGSSQQIIANNGGGNTTATIGTGTLQNGTMTYPSPYGQYYGSDHEQYLIRASELTAAGLTAGALNSIAFNLATGYTSAALKDYTIKIAPTTLTAMSASFASSNFTTVYTNALYTPPASAGWATINLSTPFNWDGTSNIIVDVSFLECTTCNTTSSCSTTWSTNGNGVVYQTSTAFTSVYAVYADANCTVPSFTPSGSFNTLSGSQRPNMRFTSPLPSNPIAWTTVTGLYKDAGLTQPLAATDTNKTVYASPTTNTTYTAVSRFQGCSSAASNTSVITVNPVPSAAVTYSGPTTFCKGNTLTLNGPTGTGLSYTWKRGIQVIGNATASSYVVDSTGSYTLTVTNSFSCSTTSTPVVVIVNPLPPTDITIGSSTRFCAGDSVVLTAPAAPTGSTYTYVWKNGTTPIAGATNRTYTATAAVNAVVTVTNTATGCSATTPTPVAVTIGAPAAPLSAPVSTICAGQSARLVTDSSFGLKYRWYKNDTLISGASNFFYSTSVAGTYKVRVSSTRDTACATTSSPLTLTITPLPTATVTATGDTTFCAGRSVTLNANTGTGLTYQWMQGSSPAPGVNNGATYSATAAGNYSVIVTNTATTCSGTSRAITVTVNALPAPTVNATPAVAICQGQKTVLSSSITGVSYLWSLNNNPTSITTRNDTVNVAGNYTVTVTDAKGCVGTSPVASVVINPLPPTAVTPSGPVSICNGSAVFLSGPRISGLSYQWKLGTANASGTSTGATYSATTAGTYRLIVTNTATGCVDTSATTTVTIFPATAASMTPSAALTACDTVKLRTTDTGVTYQWNYNGAPIAGATSNIYYARVSGTYSLTNTRTTNGCSATTAGVAVTINQSPAATITYSSPTRFCIGGAITLNTSSSTGLTYQWLDSGVAVPGVTGTNYIVTATGSYAVRVANPATGCARTSQPVEVIVNPLPTPVIASSGANGTVLTTTQPFSTYQWYLNTQPIAGAVQRTYIATQNGAYAVAVTDSIGCTNVSSISFINSLGVAGGPAAASLRIYPNPTSGVLHVDAAVNVDLVLRDITGKIVAQEKGTRKIDLGQLADGMYLLYVSTADGQLIKAEKITKHTAN